MDKYNVQYNNHNTIAITFFLPTSSLSIANSFFPMPLPSLSLTCLFTPHCHHSFPFLFIAITLFLSSSLPTVSFSCYCLHSLLPPSSFFIAIIHFLSFSLISLFSFPHHCQQFLFSCHCHHSSPPTSISIANILSFPSNLPP